MWQVPLNELRSWARLSSGGTWNHPRSVDTLCPHCHRLRGFTLVVDRNHVRINSAIHSRCPGCEKAVKFWIVDADNEEPESWGGSVWLHPDPPTRKRLPVEGVLTPRLVADYQAAQISFDNGIWRAAAQMARTVLEGVVSTLLEEPREGRSLARLLESLAEKADLAEPVRNVGKALRDGGNVASHFDDGQEITEAFAAEMLALLDAFIEYLLLLPQRTRRLAELLEQPEG